MSERNPYYERIPFNYGKPFVFVSFSHDDEKVVKADIAELNQRGVNIWHDGLVEFGKKWDEDQVDLLIYQSSMVLFYVSEHSITSPEVLHEIVIAVKYKIPIIQVCLFNEGMTIESYVRVHRLSPSLSTHLKTAIGFTEVVESKDSFSKRKPIKYFYDALMDNGILPKDKEVVNLPISTQHKPLSANEPVTPADSNRTPAETSALSEVESQGTFKTKEPSPESRPATVRKIRVTSYFISGGTKYYTLEFEGQVKHIKETDIISSKFMPSESEMAAAPESDVEYYNIGGGSDFSALLIPDKRFIHSESGFGKGCTKKASAGGMLYKIASGAFNAQAEVVASRLAKYTNLGEHMDYEMCVVNGECATRSADFVAKKEFETVETLHRKLTGLPTSKIYDPISLEALYGYDLFDYICDIVMRGIGLDLTSPNVLRPLSLLLQFDALIMNENRNFDGIKFTKRHSTPVVWELAPAHDFSCSLFSCVETLTSLESYHKPSLPFFSTHKEQLEWLYSISGARLTVAPFNVEDLTGGIWDSTNTIGKREIETYLQSVQKQAAFDNLRRELSEL